jgi:amino-acid N-acetyltransferase
MPVLIGPANVEDLGAIHALLHAQDLPTSNIDEGSLKTFLVLREGPRIFGVVGLDVLGSAAMLRSLVVRPERKGDGLGGQLVAAAEALALKSGVLRLYLLTMDADGYFAAKGYRKLERNDAPPEIQQHPQFRSLCPSTSAFMTKILGRDP